MAPDLRRLPLLLFLRNAGRGADNVLVVDEEGVVVEEGILEAFERRRVSSPPFLSRSLFSLLNSFTDLSSYPFFRLPNHNDSFLRVPQLGNTIGPVSPTNPGFPNRSAEDLEKGGLSLTITDDGEKEASLGFGHKKSGIAVRVERNVVEE